MNSLTFHLTIVVLLTMFSACTTARINSNSATIPEMVIGDFHDDYGSAYSITESRWTHDSTYRYNILEWYPKQQFVIARNDSLNPVDANLFTRIDFVPLDNMEPWKWAYCLTAYDAPSPESAAATSANAASPRDGCNGFPFTRMQPAK